MNNKINSELIILHKLSESKRFMMSSRATEKCVLQFLQIYSYCSLSVLIILYSSPWHVGHFILLNGMLFPTIKLQIMETMSWNILKDVNTSKIVTESLWISSEFSFHPFWEILLLFFQNHSPQWERSVPCESILINQAHHIRHETFWSRTISALIQSWRLSPLICADNSGKLIGNGSCIGKYRKIWLLASSRRISANIFACIMTNPVPFRLQVLCDAASAIRCSPIQGYFKLICLHYSDYASLVYFSISHVGVCLEPTLRI